ncbi:Acyl carrier protein 1 [Hibiscus syriacus]|uniref:Acyl carrier protein n=1 Tax=Hibiscus syriacus TaxID=106335 RepID=A0A6A2X3D3_HIBSY|nr:acyl carrier protein 1, chloroplastic-like [Hibiscus syriacus]KAE8663150.1 Acyl carrier protein 1 [Hibiscus syriacus]
MASLAGSSIVLQPRHAGATSRVSGLKLVSFMSQRRSSLSFGLRPMPARLRISCAAKPETVDKVCEIVRKQLAVPSDKPVTGESKFAELGADSLDTVEIVMGLEEEFGITVEEDNAQNIATVLDAAELIDKLCSEKSA